MKRANSSKIIFCFVLLVSIAAMPKITNAKTKLEETTGAYCVTPGEVITEVKVRSSPDTNSPILKVLKKGEKIYIEDVVGKWAKLAWAIEAWVEKKYLKILDKFTSEEAESAIAIDFKTISVGEVIADKLNVRSGPGLSCSKIISVEKGTKVPIENEKESEKWLKLVWAQDAWIYKKHIKILDKYISSKEAQILVSEIMPYGYKKEYPIITRPVFGINLGETLASIIGKCRSAGITIDYSPFGTRGGVSDFEGSLGHNLEVKKTRVIFFDVQIFIIILYFADHTRENYEILKTTLEEKYGPIKEKRMGTLKEAVTFNAFLTDTFLDNQRVSIILNRDIPFGKDPELTIKYIYYEIATAAGKEEENKKREKINKWKNNL